MGSLDASIAQNEDLRGDDEEGDPTTESGTIQQSGVAVSFLINQHKLEILDTENEFRYVLKQTFNREFMNMLQVCIFVPFLHAETPKPINVPKTAPVKDGIVPQANMIRDVLNFRIKIGQVQKEKQERRRLQLEIQEQNYLHQSFEHVPESNAAITQDTKFTLSKDSAENFHARGLKKQWESMDEESAEYAPNTQAFPTPRDMRRSNQREKSEEKKTGVLAVSTKLEGPMKKFKRKSPRRGNDRSVEEKVPAQHNSISGKKKSIKGKHGEPLASYSLPRTV